MFKFTALFFLLFAVSSVSFSQSFDSTKTVIIILNDDTEITGKITAKDLLLRVPLQRGAAIPAS